MKGSTGWLAVAVMLATSLLYSVVVAQQDKT
jgi:hypothetical protein